MQTSPLPFGLSPSTFHYPALPTVFAIFGFLMGSWGSRIPAIRDSLQISHFTLSCILLCGGLGAALSYPIVSLLLKQYGARKTVLYSGLGLASSLLAIGWAPISLLVMLAVLLLGVAAGCLSIALNPLATRYEQAAGKSKMSMLYALICAGSLSGALLGSFMAAMKIKALFHFAFVALIAASLLYLSYQLLEESNQDDTIQKRGFSLPTGPLALLGILSFCGAMSQNSIVDWSGVFLRDQIGATEGVAPLALSAYTAMMLISRLMGDKLKEKYGARILVSLGGIISASGLFLAVFAPHVYFALAGFAFAGLGLSFLFPFVFSAAGKEGTTASANIASMANIGGLMGPPVVGTMANYLGLQTAIGFIGLVSVVIALVAARASMLK